MPCMSTMGLRYSSRTVLRCPRRRLLSSMTSSFSSATSSWSPRSATEGPRHSSQSSWSAPAGRWWVVGRVWRRGGAASGALLLPRPRASRGPGKIHVVVRLGGRVLCECPRQRAHPSSRPTVYARVAARPRACCCRCRRRRETHVCRQWRTPPSASSARVARPRWRAGWAEGRRRRRTAALCRCLLLRCHCCCTSMSSRV